MCSTSSSRGLSLKKQKTRTYLGQLLGVRQVVNSDSQEDIQERIFWGAAKEKKTSHSKYSERFPFCCQYPAFLTGSHRCITDWPLAPLLCLHF